MFSLGGLHPHKSNDPKKSFSEKMLLLGLCIGQQGGGLREFLENQNFHFLMKCVFRSGSTRLSQNCPARFSYNRPLNLRLKIWVLLNFILSYEYMHAQKNSASHQFFPSQNLIFLDWKTIIMFTFLR